MRPASRCCEGMERVSQLEQQFGQMRVFTDKDALVDALSVHVGDLSRKAISARGCFNLVITGGQTVVPLYQQLAKLDTRWDAWNVYWSDERCLPPDHEERNSRRAFDGWLATSPIPRHQVFPIPAELGPDAAAELYEQSVSRAGRFDLVLLSLGDDGHIASLFGTGGPHDEEKMDTVAVRNAPKPPSSRVSLSLRRLADTDEAILLAVGSGKHRVLKETFTGSHLPAAQWARMAAVERWVDYAAAFGPGAGA